MSKHDPPKLTAWPIMPPKNNVPLSTAQHWALVRLNSIMATAQEHADNQEYEELFHKALRAFEQGWLMLNEKEK
jgi:hypothetical protein